METDARRGSPGHGPLHPYLDRWSVGYLVCYEISQNTTDSMQETLHVIVTAAADVTLSAATLLVAAIVGTKTLSAMVRHLHRREETHSTRVRRT